MAAGFGVAVDGWGSGVAVDGWGSGVAVVVGARVGVSVDWGEGVVVGEGVFVGEGVRVGVGVGAGLPRRQASSSSVATAPPDRTRNWRRFRRRVFWPSVAMRFSPSAPVSPVSCPPPIG